MKNFVSSCKLYVYKYHTYICVGGIISLFLLYGFLLRLTYFDQFGDVILDANNHIISITPNQSDEVAYRENVILSPISNAIIAQEDQQFYYHFGFNPWRISHGIYSGLRGKKIGAVSTIPEQLVKNLLHHNNKRSLINKATELVGAVVLSVMYSKDEMMGMYVNSAPVGRGIRGLQTASQYYYGKKLEKLSQQEISILLLSLKNPEKNNPYALSDRDINGNKLLSLYPLRSIYNPELTTYCKNVSMCETSIDKKLQDTLRLLAKNVTEDLFSDGGENAAIVILDIKQKKVRAIIGTPEPTLLQSGYQLNMANEYRAIGSTIKPFIYAKAFEGMAGPLTLVNDAPVGLPLNSGFTMFPKNFDGNYRGWVTLEEALSQSLNIPAVKVLQFVSLTNFYEWLEGTLRPLLLQKGIDYGSSTALGSLELTPSQLAYFFSIFGQQGKIMPYSLQNGTPWLPKGITSNTIEEREILTPSSVFEVNSILSNRHLGVAQFGVNSNLQLGITNYALKTGTSKNYHDSWVVGYSPEIVALVWIGNAHHDPMNEITGQKGAGELWERVMNTLIDYGYIHDVPFSQFKENHSERIAYIPDTTALLFPKSGDTLRIKKDSPIILETSEHGTWNISHQIIGTGNNVKWNVLKSGTYNGTFTYGKKVEYVKFNVEVIK